MCEEQGSLVGSPVETGDMRSHVTTDYGCSVAWRGEEGRGIARGRRVGLIDRSTGRLSFSLLSLSFFSLLSLTRSSFQSAFRAVSFVPLSLAFAFTRAPLDEVEGGGSDDDR